MNVRIKSVNFEAASHLIEFIEGKMSKLERFTENVVDAEVTLKVDKDHEHGNKVALIGLHLPGVTLLAEQRSKSFEEAVDEGVDALKKQVVKHKEKHKN